MRGYLDVTMLMHWVNGFVLGDLSVELISENMIV